MMKTKKNSPKYATVMLIDDNELDNFVNQKMVEGNNFAEKIYVNTSGISALEFLQNISVNIDLAEKLMPDVIFVDINMPLMDGFQFIEKFELLTNVAKKKSKIVILTTSLDPEDKKRTSLFKNEILFFNKPLTDDTLQKV